MRQIGGEELFCSFNDPPSIGGGRALRPSYLNFLQPNPFAYRDNNTQLLWWDVMLCFGLQNFTSMNFGYHKFAQGIV